MLVTTATPKLKDQIQNKLGLKLLLPLHEDNHISLKDQIQNKLGLKLEILDLKLKALDLKIKSKTN